MKYFDSELATVNYIEKCKTVEIIWKGAFVVSAKYREILTKALEVIDKYKITGWLSDMTLQKIVTSEDKKWVDDVVIPHAFNHGLKKAAFIVPENVFAKLYAEKVRNSLETAGHKFMYFQSTEEAYKWLAD